jgi:predicted amidohydrolase
MRAALIVQRVDPDTHANLSRLLSGIDEAAAGGADLVVFGEAVLSGIGQGADSAADLPLACSIPGVETRAIADLAVSRCLWIALGVLERDSDRLYDSALLFSPDGEISLRYRRISPGWRQPDADTSVYREGDELMAVETEFGRIAFLICGDLFDDTLLRRVERMKPDLLLIPMERAFEDGSHDVKRWETVERPAYFNQLTRTKTAAALVNTLAPGGAFGGSMVLNREGVLIAELPIGSEGMLMVDLEFELPEGGSQ